MPRLPSEETPVRIIENRVRPDGELVRAIGCTPKAEAIVNRKTSGFGLFMRHVPGLGGDVWYVLHGDGKVAIYMYYELEVLTPPAVPAKDTACTVAQLMDFMKRHDIRINNRVVVQGYEGGYEDAKLAVKDIALNTRQPGMLGSHDDPEGVDHDSSPKIERCLVIERGDDYESRPNV